jgi:hypothetical protein
MLLSRTKFNLERLTPPSFFGTSFLPLSGIVIHKSPQIHPLPEIVHLALNFTGVLTSTTYDVFPIICLT